MQLDQIKSESKHLEAFSYQKMIKITYQNDQISKLTTKDAR